MYATAAISLVNWFRVGRPLLGCRGCRKLGLGGAQSLFTGTNHGCNDNVEHQYQWRMRYTSSNAAASCTSPLSAIHLSVVAPMSPVWNQRRKFYVVRRGKIPGIYDSWEECKQQVQGFSGNKYKGFSSMKEAENYLHAHGMKSIIPCLDVKDSMKDLHEAKPACLRENLLKAVSSAEGHLENSAKSKRSRKKAAEAEENLKNSPKFKRSRKKPDAADPVILSVDKFICEKCTIPEKIESADLLKVNTLLEECINKPSKSRGSTKKLKAANANEDLVKVSSLPEGPLKKSSKSRISGKKLNMGDSNEDLLEVTSPLEECVDKSSKSRRSRKKLEAADANEDLLRVSSLPEEPVKKSSKSRISRNKLEVGDSNEYQALYQLEFDGASKGNPGKAGAGAVLRNQDGSVVCKLREGVGVATNNVAEYRAVILGLKVALSKGITRIQVQGDSKLVCMQIQDLWKTKNENIVDLSKEAKELKSKFKSFQIIHVERACNSEADALANAAITLQNGEQISSKAGAKAHGLKNL